MIQHDVNVVRITPRRMLIYFEKRLIRSFEHEMTLADKFVPICATTQQKPTKKAPHRPPGPSHCAASSNGDHIYSPYTTLAQEVLMTPNIDIKRLITGRKSACQYTPLLECMYLVKSGILVAMVAQPPHWDEKLLRIIQERAEPEVVYS